MMDAPSTILIADDDPIGRKLIQTKLFGENYKLVFAADGQEALDKIKEIIPDIVLLDVMMPEMDGFTVCEKMREYPQLQHIPVVMVTALDGRDDVARGAQVGANDFLRKPVNSFELRARIRSLIGMKKQLSTVDTQMQFRNNMEDAINRHIIPAIDNVFSLGHNFRQRATEPLDVDESKKLLEGSRQLQSLVSNLLLLVKMEKEGFILRKDPTNLNKFLQTMFDRFQPAAKAKHINLALDLPDKSSEVPLDASLFTRMISNLLEYALESTPPKGTVTLRAIYPQSNAATDPIKVQVIDDAPAMSEKQILALFTSPQPADKKFDLTAFGTGLAICKNIAKAHGGNVSIRPNDPTGNTYTIEI